LILILGYNDDMNYDPYTIRNHLNNQSLAQYSSYEDFYKFFEVGPQGVVRESELGAFPTPFSSKEDKKKKLKQGASDPTGKIEDSHSLNPSL
jgi:hypothetical protein